MREKNYKNNTHTQPCSFEKLQLCSVPFVYKETPCKVSFVQKNKLSLLKKCYVHRWDNCISFGFFFSLSLSKQNVTKNSLPRQRKIPEISMIMNVLNGVWCWNVLVFFFSSTLSSVLPKAFLWKFLNVICLEIIVRKRKHIILIWLILPSRGSGFGVSKCMCKTNQTSMIHREKQLEETISLVNMVVTFSE